MTDAQLDQVREDAAECPMHMHDDVVRHITPDDVLVLPLHRRSIAQYALNDDGVRELHLYCGDKDISFDEPDLFAFGETLVKHAQFTGRDAMRWGEGYAWPRIGHLLEQLIDEGVLVHARESEIRADRQAGRSCPSPLPPAPAEQARSWHDCEAITADLTGRSVEAGYLEMVMPIFRIAHAAVDQDGRQVGEANVFPRALRLEAQTDWMTCIYPGSRYQATKPMNVTALKAMRNHWRPMMATLLRIREAYLQRCPDARKGWTVGHLERLATTVLAMPTYQLMRVKGKTENGTLHPVLSSLFRVTDGLRMVLHQMLFIPVGEPTRSPLDRMTSAEIYAYAERNYAFYSDFGVCAGPRAMVEEFLNVLVDGDDSRGFSAEPLGTEIEATLCDLDQVLDYAFLGLQAYAVGFSLWPAMTRTYEQLAALSGQWDQTPSPALAMLAARLKGRLDTVKSRTFLASEDWRIDREAVYADMYAQCGLGLSKPHHAAPLDKQLSDFNPSDGLAIKQQLISLLTRSLGSDQPVAIAQIADCLMAFFSRVQAIMDLGTEVQTSINTLLGRAAPQRPFEAGDMDVHNLLQGEDSQRLPFLLDEIRDVLGLHVTITRTKIKLTYKEPARDLAP